MKKLLLALLVIFMPSLVEAACSNEVLADIMKEGRNVKANFEILERELSKDEFTPPDGLTEEEIENLKVFQDYFKITILNVTENIYLEITNDVDSETITINYEDTESGVFAFNTEETSVLKTYTIKSYSTHEDCYGESLSTEYLSTPRQNSYYNNTACIGYENESFCQKYVTTKNDSYQDFLDDVEDKRQEEKEQEEKEAEMQEATQNYIVTGIIVATVSALIIVIYIIIKKRKEKL